VLHWATGYDLLAWLFLFGRERAFRERLVKLGRVRPGESVLDVGCGTGNLALAAKRRAGPNGKVCGIDASPEMIARAQKKSRKAGVEIAFENAAAESLPFPDAHFDVVFSTLMLHHLPAKTRAQCIAEIRRVLKPGGRALAVDFGKPERRRKSILPPLHRHGHVNFADVIALFTNSGFSTIESGEVGTKNLHFALAVTPDPTATRTAEENQTSDVRPKPTRWPTRAWIIPLAIIAIIAGHGIPFYFLSRIVAPIAVGLGVLAVIAAHALLRRD
jgi:ubiquinone/menaquinone biosynthesis C-methylase UbiE